TQNSHHNIYWARRTVRGADVRLCCAFGDGAREHRRRTRIVMDDDTHSRPRDTCPNTVVAIEATPPLGPLTTLTLETLDSWRMVCWPADARLIAPFSTALASQGQAADPAPTNQWPSATTRSKMQ